MIDASTIKSKIKNALLGYSQQNTVPCSSVQISIAMDEKNLKYYFLKNYKQDRIIDFKKDILNIKIDIFSIEEMANKIIGVTIVQLSETYGCNPFEMDILIAGKDADADPVIHVYKDKCKTHLASPSFEEVFAVQNLMKK